jgi:pyrimidine-specific ribonucleoside hydrolase
MRIYLCKNSIRLCSLLFGSVLLFSAVSCLGVKVPISSTPTPFPSQTAVPANTAEANLALRTSHNVIIDTDMAVDDWMAILYLLYRKDVNVRAITVTGAGEAHCDAGVQNALGLITLAQHFPIPVACGPEIPLQGNHAFPQGWRDFVDGLAGQALSASVNPGAGIDAIKLLTQTLLSSPEKITLLTLGPLTNVAFALQATPMLANQIAGVYVMGGAVHVPGNLDGNVTGNTAAEWNIYIDPHAANVVFASGVPVTLVGLDATDHAPLTMDFFQRLETNQKTNATKFIHSVLNQMQDSIRSGTYYFWDPLSAVILVDNNLATYQQYSICVVETEGTESGRTEVKDGCPQLKVAVSVDAGRFEQVFLDTLNSQPALATVNLSSLKGTWSGTSHNDNLDMQVTITLTGICNTGIPCGTFNIATLPCSGEYVFMGMTGDNQYEFAEINKQGVCGYGQDFFQLQAEGTLLFKSMGDYGINSGFLNKTTP